MSRIVHLALKVEDLERTTQFYREVFGFSEMSTDRVRDHTSRHLSDGTIDLALIQYDAGTQSAESRAAGEAHSRARLRDHQRPRCGAGEIPLAGRHRLRNRARGPLSEAEGHGGEARRPAQSGAQGSQE